MMLTVKGCWQQNTDYERMDKKFRYFLHLIIFYVGQEIRGNEELFLRSFSKQYVKPTLPLL